MVGRSCPTAMLGRKRVFEKRPEDVAVETDLSTD